ncbi:MAG: helix-turn-helix transcriptional regulator, partial [Alphaproteobacteria bacterium]|nr:helix-turn-helix transcriptional regulator [Alphaproteobacteria bacterium]
MADMVDLMPMLEAIVSYMDDGVIVADENGDLAYQN